MTKKIKFSDTTNKLVLWGQKNPRNFPWREVSDPWLGLLAEILLQRTNANHVTAYFTEFSQIFPTPEALLTAAKDDLDKIENRLGLDRRLRTLVELAEFIDTQDIYPTDYETLTNLYGIGHYTASAYLSLHMNVRAVLVDSNVARWLARFTGQPKPKDVRHCKWLWDLAETLTPLSNFKRYNYAVLDFTMTVCKPKSPDCTSCPIRTLCKFSKQT